MEANSLRLLESDMVRLDIPLDRISLAFAFRFRRASLNGLFKLKKKVIVEKKITWRRKVF